MRKCAKHLIVSSLHRLTPNVAYRLAWSQEINSYAALTDDEENGNGADEEYDASDLCGADEDDELDDVVQPKRRRTVAAVEDDIVIGRRPSPFPLQDVLAGVYPALKQWVLDAFLGIPAALRSLLLLVLMLNVVDLALEDAIRSDVESIASRLDTAAFAYLRAFENDHGRMRNEPHWRRRNRGPCTAYQA